MIGGALPVEAPAGWRPAGRPRLVIDVVDQVGDRVHDPRGQEREPPGPLAGGDARQDQDALEAGYVWFVAASPRIPPSTSPGVTMTIHTICITTSPCASGFHQLSPHGGQGSSLAPLP